jgi:deazaflavin-dependent oxidoreductase (nitroreductase family)
LTTVLQGIHLAANGSQRSHDEGTNVADWNAQIIDEFRANAGKVGGMFAGAPLLLLHSTGAKSGNERLNPLMYQAIEGGYAIFASKAGAPSNPDWFYNVVANPEVAAEIGSDKINLTARVASSDEREPIWTMQKSTYPTFADYEATAEGREIPVVILKPR